MKLDDVFDVEVAPPKVPVQPAPVEVPVTDTMIEYDYQSARSNIYSVLQAGEDALNHALEVAKAKEEPRAFEVVGGLLKNLADINKQLLELADIKQKLMEKERRDVPTTQTITNNNAIFVGSTNELNKMIAKMTGE